MKNQDNTQGKAETARKAYSSPKVILAADFAETRGGLQNPAVSGEVKFPSLATTSNYNLS